MTTTIPKVKGRLTTAEFVRTYGPRHLRATKQPWGEVYVLLVSYPTEHTEVYDSCCGSTVAVHESSWPREYDDEGQGVPAKELEVVLVTGDIAEAADAGLV